MPARPSPTRLAALSLVVAALAACKTPVPRYCETSADCADEDGLPFCDLQGQYAESDFIDHTCIPFPDGLEPDGGPGDPDGGPGQPDAMFCSPDAFRSCLDGNTALFCNAGGSAEVEFDCADGCDAGLGGCVCTAGTETCDGDQHATCNASGTLDLETCALGCAGDEPRCLDVAPSNGLGTYLDMTDSAPAVTLPDGSTINTDTGAVADGDGTAIVVPSALLAAPANGVAVRVLMVSSITLNDVTTTGAAALAIVSDGDILIRGTVRVLAGARPGCAGPAGQYGGAGGGFGGAGGAGTDSDTNTAAGPVNGNTSLIPLRGGCSGGGVFGGNLVGSPGGGAIQLVSRTAIQLQDLSAGSLGVLNAGGRALPVSGGYFPGGGSGGGLLLEAPVIELAGLAVLAANGAGGACNVAPPAEDGQPTDQPATGATCSGVGDDSSGTGGSAVAAAGSGLTGGGGVGRIRINGTLSAGSAITSPAASLGALATR